MKKIVIKIIIGCFLLAIPSALNLQNIDKDYKSVQTNTEKTIKEVSEVFNSTQITEEEEKRVKLYIAVMREAFKIQNGGNRFIAIKKDALVGLDEKSKEKVLEGFKDLSPNLYWFEDIKDNETFFIHNKYGQIAKTNKGTLLYINVIEFMNNEAVIETTSWYGLLGAVIPTYKAIYKNEQWELKNIGTGVA